MKIMLSLKYSLSLGSLQGAPDEGVRIVDQAEDEPADGEEGERDAGPDLVLTVLKQFGALQENVADVVREQYHVPNPDKPAEDVSCFKTFLCLSSLLEPLRMRVCTRQ